MYLMSDFDMREMRDLREAVSIYTGLLKKQCLPDEFGHLCAYD